MLPPAAPAPRSRSAPGRPVRRLRSGFRLPSAAAGRHSATYSVTMPRRPAPATRTSLAGGGMRASRSVRAPRKQGRPACAAAARCAWLFGTCRGQGVEQGVERGAAPGCTGRGRNTARRSRASCSPPATAATAPRGPGASITHSHLLCYFCCLLPAVGCCVLLLHMHARCNTPSR